MQQKIAQLKWKPSLGFFAPILILVLGPAILVAQAVPLTLDEAFGIASRNYPQLKQDRQFIEQQNALIRSAASLPNTGVFVSGDEVDPNSTRGIHSLGLRQDFNWPGAKGRREEAIRQQALWGNARLELDQLELRRQVARAYYKVLFFRNLQELMREQVGLFTELVELAQLRFELGETGKIPVLSAQGKQKEATLGQLQANEDYEIALTIFNNW
ncbi:MAG: TolC family protein, partial [Phaeodactylibacter sp.]|nr:TolC family protein [Phaeodactylibacter sp.]